MIFTPHIIVGATIGAKTQNLGLIIILGFLTHFIMDKIPHWDYDLPAVFRNFRKDKKIKPFVSDLVKLLADIIIGLSLVFVIIWYKNNLDFHYLFFISIGITISILPDVFLGLVHLTSGKTARKINKIGELLHCKQKEGKITSLGLLTEILVTIIAVVILLL